MSKQKKYHYIYKTTCSITGKFYVGMHSTDNLEDGYLGSGKILGYSRHKYGDENHVKEILEYLPSRIELKAREKEIVNEELLAQPLNINLKYGGEGGTHGKEKEIWQRPERKKQHTEMLKRNWSDPIYRAKQSAASSRTMSSKHTEGKIKYDTFIGKKHSEEAKKKMSETRKKNLAIKKSLLQNSTTALKQLSCT